MQAGAAFNDSHWLFTDVGSTTSKSQTGALAGGQIGYNYQIASFVLGIQTDAEWTGLKGSSICPNPTALCQTDQQYLAALTGRVGYAWNQVLIYAKGGGAISGDRYNVNFPATPIFNEQNSGGAERVGWTAGAGIEYAFLNNWSAFVEYDHYDFGSVNFSMIREATGAFVEHLSVRQTDETVKAGINYHFAPPPPPAPVVAKY